MGTPISVLVIILALLSIERIEFGCCRSINSNVSCIESERKALLKFRQSLVDNSNRLSSWDGEDCCTWNGIVCNNRTGHVVRLQLHNPISLDFDSDQDSFANYDDLVASYFAYAENYSRNRLGGEINPSLLVLKHLRYLDLSNNGFDGIQIPEFLASFKKLRFLNLSDAGFQGKVSHHLGNLSSLQYLDLGSNYYLTVDSLWWASTLSSLKHLDLTYVDLSEATDWLYAINMLPSLLELNLANCQLHSIPSLSHVNFTSLSSLDLQSNYIASTIPIWLTNITGLSHLHLHGSFFQGSVPDTLGRLTSLTVLDLSYNYFDTSISNWLCKLSSLEILDFSGNKFQGSIPRCIGNLTSLAILDLNSNSLNGSIPSEMSNIIQLTVLNLNLNEFEGEIPNTMSNLCSLRIADLSHNKFSGEFPSFLRCPSGCIQISLRELNLGYNKFDGFLPNQLGDFKNLEHLFLDSNSFSGPIPASIGRLSSLRSLGISDNKLNGSVPSRLGELSKLAILDVSKNSLAGMVCELHFAKLARLNELYMSLNSLVLNVSSKWVPPFQLRIIHMASCKLGTQFPQWLQTHRHVEELIISNASISDTIPDWFENVYAKIYLLDLSYNQISGKLPKFQEYFGVGSIRQLIFNSNKFKCPLTPFPSDVVLLDLSNNLLLGHLPLIDDNVTMKLEALILSNNNLTGGIPTYLCKMRTMAIIDLSKNQLSGRLPWCLGNLQELKVLDLTNNNLYGDIPSSLGSLPWLKFLHLHNNKFQGKLPLSLQNLTDLVTLDLGKNAFTGVIPLWIGEKLSNLKILSLQSNKFYGDIPPQLCRLTNLQLLDLAQNHITGDIPHCFGNFTAMVVDHRAEENDKEYVVKHFSESYQENLLHSIKGRELEYTKTIPFLTSIDLSNNHIVGEISEKLMDLFGLRNLNLAGNHLQGRIPEKIGNLRQLESLDLSRNKLVGPIPPSMTALNFLSHLNLSFNNLSGQIPTGNQLQTLDDQSIYMGNNGLCGPPLLKKCSSDKPSDGHEDVGESKGGDEPELLWFYAGIGPGFLVGFLGVCGILHFLKSWRYAYFQFMDKIYNRLLVAIELKAAWVQRKFHKGEVRG